MKLNIALVAHDQKKQDLSEWAKFNKASLAPHHLLATGTTGNILETVLDVPIEKLHSGPLGGDQEIGARIVNDEIDLLIFFWDPMDAHPHEPDVRALLRLAVLYNIPTASNRKTADMLISSTLFGGHIKRTKKENA
jgi:methylglyoxal synthase